MGADIPKQYLELDNRCVLAHSLSRLVAHPRIAGVVVALAADDAIWPSLNLADNPKILTTVGGAERCHSVLAGIEALRPHAAPDDWVLVHDAARPCLRSGDIDRMMDTLKNHPWGGILGVPVRDTLKCCDDSGAIVDTVDRKRLWHAHTPQMFRLTTLADAIGRAIENGTLVTDEAQAIEMVGGVPRIVEGHGDNIKITQPADLVMARLFIAAQQAEDS